MEQSPSTQPQNIKVYINDFNNQEGIIYYNITVIHLKSNKSQKIQARYSQLLELNENILKFIKKNKNIHIQLPPFPAKKWWAVQDDEFLNQRKNELQTFLQELLLQPDSLQVDSFHSFLLGDESDEESKQDLSMNNAYFEHTNQIQILNTQIQIIKKAKKRKDKLNLLRTQHNDFNNAQRNTSASSKTNQAVCENYEEQERQTLENEIYFPYSFCELSMGQRNQQICLGSFTEDIQSIKRKSIDQSDFENNSSIMCFFASPQNSKIVAQQNQGQNYRKEDNILRSSLQQSENAKSNTSSQIQNQDGVDNDQDNYSSFLQQALNCINKNKTIQPNIYNHNLEEYKQTQRTFKREVEQIIESSEISSVVELNIFVDSDEEQENEDSQNINPNKFNSNKNQQLQSSKNECRCYNSDSDSEYQSESSDDAQSEDESHSLDDSQASQNSQSQKSYTKSFQQNNSKILTPIMQKSTDDDCAATKKKKTLKPKSHTQSYKRQRYNSENILQLLYINSSHCLSSNEKLSPIIQNTKQDQKGDVLSQYLRQNLRSKSSLNSSSQNESTNTLYLNEEDQNEQELAPNQLNILKDIQEIVQTPKSLKSQAIYISNTNQTPTNHFIQNQHNNQQQNFIQLHQ